MQLSAEEKTVIAAVDRSDARMRAQVVQWSAINSGSANLDGLGEMAALLSVAFTELGGSITLVDPAPVERVDAAGVVRAVAHGRNLHLRQRPDAPVRVLLTGHMDTVFAADHPFQTVRVIDDNVINGPGAADMKGGIAVMLSALLALEASPLADRIGYDVVINSDEEVSSPGSAPLLAQAAATVQLGLTYEPALPDGTLAGARKGSGNFAIVIRGCSAHAGRNPEDGRNAILAAADLALRLAALRRDGLGVNIARIDGGGPNNIVPDLAVLRFNMRPSSAAYQQGAEAAIAGTMQDVAAAHDVTAELHGGFSRPPKPMDETQRGLFELVRSCGRDLGLAIGWRDTGGVCDGNNLAALGLPVVDTMGARGGAIHSAEEFLLLDSLVERARLSVLLLMRIAAGGLPARASG
jgi:glutamate carboxypeptidase